MVHTLTRTVEGVGDKVGMLLSERRAYSGTALAGVTLSPKRAREPKVQYETWERCSVAQVVGGDLVPIGHVRMLLFFLRGFAGRWKVLEHCLWGKTGGPIFKRSFYACLISLI